MRARQARARRLTSRVEPPLIYPHRPDWIDPSGPAGPCRRARPWRRTGSSCESACRRQACRGRPCVSAPRLERGIAGRPRNRLPMYPPLRRLVSATRTRRTASGVLWCRYAPSCDWRLRPIECSCLCRAASWLWFLEPCGTRAARLACGENVGHLLSSWCCAAARLWGGRGVGRACRRCKRARASPSAPVLAASTAAFVACAFNATLGRTTRQWVPRTKRGASGTGRRCRRLAFA